MVDFKYKALPLRSVYALLEESGFATDAAVLREAIPGKGLPLRRAKRGMALQILRAKGLLEKFISEYWPNGATNDGHERIARYDKYFKQWAETAETVEEKTEAEVEDETDSDADSLGLYERDLRDYLAKNLSTLEAGMKLWDTTGDQSAIEFYADDHRRIDILAKDQLGTPVVIELKLKRGHDRVIGQALYYRECIKEKFNAQKVRIIMIAREISHELRMASKGLSDVDLYEYQLSMTLKKC